MIHDGVLMKRNIIKETIKLNEYEYNGEKESII